MPVLATEMNEAALLELARKHARTTGPGFLSALALHAIAIALIVLLRMQIGSPPPLPAQRVVPVDVVQLGEETASLPSPLISAVPQQKRVPAQRLEQTSPVAPEGVSPQANRPVPLINLEAKLRALARLRQPETDARVAAVTGTADVTSTSNDAISGDQAAYGVRDFVRQHVVRHWSLDLHVLGKRSFEIAIRIVMSRTGVIRKAEIVDMERYRTDAIFRDIALSARNAVLLSSPVPLPAGDYPEQMDLVLNFNPKDALQ